MQYQIRYSAAAQKQLDKLAWRDYLPVHEHILTLKSNPSPIQAIKLAESDYYRLRAGQYRVIYSIDNEQKLIMIVRVMRRSEKTYRGL